jgi:hypothetical protein
MGDAPLGHKGGTGQPGGPEAVLLPQTHRRRGLDLALGQRGENGAAVEPVRGLRLLANGVGHIARAEPGPGAAEEPGPGQEVEPYPPVGYILAI